MSYRQPVITERAALRPLAHGRRWKFVQDQVSMVRQVPVPIRPIVRAGGTYLGEDEQYYYYMEPNAGNELNGFFDSVGNMFKRMVKVTPKSFTPGNIYEGFINTTLTAASGGLYQALPKDLKKTVYEVGKVAVPVVAGGVLAYTAGPAVMATLMPKLTQAGSILEKGAGSVMNFFSGGKAPAAQDPNDYSVLPGAESRQPLPGVDTSNHFGSTIADKAMTIGGEFLSRMISLPPQAQAQVAQEITAEQLAYMQRYGTVPPEVLAMFNRAAINSLPPSSAASTGAASMYEGYGSQAPQGKPVEAGMFGEMNLQTILLFAVPAVFFLFMNKGAKR